MAAHHPIGFYLQFGTPLNNLLMSARWRKSLQNAKELSAATLQIYLTTNIGAFINALHFLGNTDAMI
jgi:hypothetical protein